MAVNNAVNEVPTISGTTNQIFVTQAVGTSTASVALTSPFFNTAQPLFFAYLSTDQNNVTGDGTDYKVIFDTVSMDQNSNYNNSTGVFTAPATAKYYLNTLVRGLNSTAGTLILQSYFILTSGTYLVGWQIMLTLSNASSGQSIMVPMTAGDTAYVQILATTGTKNVSVLGAASPIQTYFSAYLIP
jgi:hypothetical protein